MHGQLRGANLDHISGIDTPGADLPSTIHDYRRTADRRDAQTAQGAGHHDRVMMLDPRRSELQVLIGSAADGQLASVDEDATRFRGALWRATDGGPAQ
jgi:hypothetical protein